MDHTHTQITVTFIVNGERVAPGENVQAFSHNKEALQDGTEKRIGVLF
jgi:hypothetical protein